MHFQPVYGMVGRQTEQLLNESPPFIIKTHSQTSKLAQIMEFPGVNKWVSGGPMNLRTDTPTCKDARTHLKSQTYPIFEQKTFFILFAT